MPRLTKAQRLARQGMIRFLHEEALESSDLSLSLRDKVPVAWHTLEHDLDVREPKVKITLCLDQSVAKFYRAMGEGYQARINRILALWAHMKIGNALRMEEAVRSQMKQIAADDQRQIERDGAVSEQDLAEDVT